MTYPENQVVSYGYDSSNAVTSVDVKQSLSSSTHSVADYVYDNMGRLTDVLLGDNSLTTYQYDDIGRLERHTLAGFHITTLGYNPANQIVRRAVTDSTMQAAMPSSAPSLYTPNNLNQYTFVDTNNPLYYDDNGNLTDYDGWDYGYDAHNRLESASRPGSTSLNLAYDPTGRLSSTTLQGSTTSFSYSGDQLIGEYNSSGNQTNLYVYAPGSDIPIARFSGGSIGPNDVTYLRADERGSIVLETDGTTVLESHQYDVYGVPLNVSDSLFRYTGQIQLKGTELYHYKARAYHPELGRFLQTDPIGYDDGMNMYAYVGNDPVNLIDPSGMVNCPKNDQNCIETPESDSNPEQGKPKNEVQENIEEVVVTGHRNKKPKARYRNGKEYFFVADINAIKRQKFKTKEIRCGRRSMTIGIGQISPGQSAVHSHSDSHESVPGHGDGSAARKGTTGMAFMMTSSRVFSIQAMSNGTFRTNVASGPPLSGAERDSLISNMQNWENPNSTKGTKNDPCP